MTISLSTFAVFVFTQLIPLPNGGVLKLNMDVTGQIPYTIQERTLVIQ